jgi:hypothetical protein
MGLEFAGGAWKESMRASQSPAALQVRESADGLEITFSAVLNGQTLRRQMWLRGDTPLIRCRVSGRAAEGTSLILRFATGVAAQQLVMDAPGGMVARPSRRFYDPTFWPLHHFAHLHDSATGRGMAVFQPLPGAISFSPDGRLMVAMRSAVRERATLIGLPTNARPAGTNAVTTPLGAADLHPSGDWGERPAPRGPRLCQFIRG